MAGTVSAEFQAVKLFKHFK